MNAFPELRTDAYVTSALNPDGTIDQAKMKAVSPETDFSYDFRDLLLKPAKKPEGREVRRIMKRNSDTAYAHLTINYR